MRFPRKKPFLLYFTFSLSLSLSLSLSIYLSISPSQTHAHTQNNHTLFFLSFVNQQCWLLFLCLSISLFFFRLRQNIFFFKGSFGLDRLSTSPPSLWFVSAQGTNQYGLSWEGRSVNKKRRLLLLLFFFFFWKALAPSSSSWEGFLRSWIVLELRRGQKWQGKGIRHRTTSLCSRCGRSQKHL